MQHSLDVITDIAQKLDTENRLLIKKNAELKQEYKAQENDRELLVRQLVMQKKENTKYKDDISEFKQTINEKKMDEEQIDINKYANENKDVNMPPIQSKLMQTRIESQQRRTGTTGFKLPPKSQGGGFLSSMAGA